MLPTLPPTRSTDTFDPTGQAPDNPLLSLFSEIEKIAGAFPILSPKDYILAYENIIQIKREKYYLCDQYEPDEIICFDTEPEVINYLLKHYFVSKNTNSNKK